MRAFIYTGGAVRADLITEHPKADDITIAADSGYHTARALGERIDVLLGDFDSIGRIPRDEAFEIRQVPAEKDYTDTQAYLSPSRVTLSLSKRITPSLSLS